MMPCTVPREAIGRLAQDRTGLSHHLTSSNNHNNNRQSIALNQFSQDTAFTGKMANLEYDPDQESPPPDHSHKTPKMLHNRD